jgi:hypothetical protein
MGVMEIDWYRKRATEMYSRPRDPDLKKPAVQVDEELADVSSGTNPGAWVQAWVWVPDPGGGSEKKGT